MATFGYFVAAVIIVSCVFDGIARLNSMYWYRKGFNNATDMMADLLKELNKK